MKAKNKFARQWRKMNAASQRFPAISFEPFAIVALNSPCTTFCVDGEIDHSTRMEFVCGERVPAMGIATFGKGSLFIRELSTQSRRENRRLLVVNSQRGVYLVVSKQGNWWLRQIASDGRVPSDLDQIKGPRWQGPPPVIIDLKSHATNASQAGHSPQEIVWRSAPNDDYAYPFRGPYAGYRIVELFPDGRLRHCTGVCFDVNKSDAIDFQTNDYSFGKHAGPLEPLIVTYRDGTKKAFRVEAGKIYVAEICDAQKRKG